MLWILATAAAAVATALVLRGRNEQRRVAHLDALWGRPRDRRRDMEAIAAYHLALTGVDASLDDRAWDDLNLDAVFAVLDRTESGIGQQALYHRLRSAPAGARLDAFEALVTHLSGDPRARTHARLALARLTDPAALDLWWLAQPDVLAVRPGHVFFPAFTAATIVIAALAIVWPPAVLLLALCATTSIVTRVVVARHLRVVVGTFRQVGPLVNVAAVLSRVQAPGAGRLVGSLGEDVAHLARLRRIATWVSRDPQSGDLPSMLFEYLNVFLLLDANALYFGARELRRRGPELLRVLAAVGEYDAANAVASFRAGTPGWTTPVFREPGEPVVMNDLRHPLVARAVPNSVTLAPPHGLIVTGSNMSGKSTFLRTVGVSVVLAQTVNTVLAMRYEAPMLVVRSCIGRSDNLIAGKSYYIVEVESVLALVAASRSRASHLFLFDELFRGTNAVERIAAGDAVLAALLDAPPGEAPRHLVLAATHDRELVDLLADKYSACHFTDTVGDEGLVFDYHLEPGPATTRNAITLLRLSGAPEGLVEHALRRAAELDEARMTRPAGRA